MKVVIRLTLGPAVMAGVVVGSLLWTSPAAAQPTPTIDLRCERAAVDVPGFGGAYVEDRVLHVWLTTPVDSVADVVVTALREECPAHDDVIVQAADYPYTQLDDWGIQALALPEVTMAGVDLRSNRLTVGVSDLDRDGPVVVAALSELGVPAEAVALREAGPFSTQPLESHNPSLAWFIALVAAVVVVGGVGALLARGRIRR